MKTLVALSLGITLTCVSINAFAGNNTKVGVGVGVKTHVHVKDVNRNRVKGVNNLDNDIVVKPKQKQDQRQKQIQKQSADNELNNNITHEAQERNPVSTAGGTPGIPGLGTCYVTDNKAMQLPALGVSLSDGFLDLRCDTRLNSQRFTDMEQHELALLQMCFIPESRILMEYKGYDCSFVDAVKDRMKTHYNQDDPNSP